MDIKVISKKYVSAASAKYNISIQADLDGFCFCIQQRNRPLALLASYPDQKETDPMRMASYYCMVLEDEPMAQSRFYSQKYCVPFSPSTLIPDTLFNIDDLNTYGRKLLGPVDDDYAYDYDIIENLQAVHVFTRPVFTLDLLRTKYPTITSIHPLTPWLEHVVQASKNNYSPRLYVNISNTHIAVLATHKGNLLFFNQFEYDSDDAILYYLLSVVKQLQLTPSSLKVFLFNATAINRTSLAALLSGAFKVKVVRPKYPAFMKNIDLRPYLHLVNIY